MRCKKCDYALWNLPARQCPECGEAFRPSEFTFVPNSVRFECPHCAQAYYGTDFSGHLVPRTFDCGRCNQRITMDEMILRPTEGVEEKQTAQITMPWVNREGRSLVSAWFRTVGLALVQPGHMMKAIPGDTSQGKAWLFALMTAIIVTIGAFSPMLLIFIVLMLLPRGGGGGAGATGVLGGMLGGTLGAAFLFVFIFLPIWGVLTHVLLRLLGKCEGGIGRTFEAICYSSGANAISAIPCVGGYVGPIWWLVSAVIATKEHQRVSGGRAAFAVLAPPLTVFGLLIALWAYALISMPAMIAQQAAAQTWTPTNAAMTSTQLTRIHTEISNYGLRQQGAALPHPLALLRKNGLPETMLIAPGSKTSPFLARIDGTTIFDFTLLDPTTQDARITRAAAALPQGTGTVRAGDMIFATSGVSLAIDPNLWMVICYPDPQYNPIPPPPGAMIQILLADGSVTGVPIEQLDAKRVEQNELRVKLGLNEIEPIGQVK